MLEKRVMSAYALHKQSGLHQSVISKIKNNKSKALQLDVLDTLCAALNCQPADLIVYESGDTTQNTPTTQNTSTTQIVERATQNVHTTQNASDNEYSITAKDAGEILDLNPRTVREKAKSGELHGKQGKQDHWFFRRVDVLAFKAQRDKE